MKNRYTNKLNTLNKRNFIKKPYTLELICIENKKQVKLMKAHLNNITISNFNLKDKYTYFEDSKLDESNTLLYEINDKPINFKKYSRGTIIKVKFGVNIGSEFSGDHYAIVISKNDTMMNPVLHVIPITSKKHKYNLKIGKVLYNKEYLENLKAKLKTETNRKNIKEIKRCMKYYNERSNKNSYACIKHLKTISKLSICRPINKYDYINKIKLPNETLKKIDKEIINEYTLL